MNLTQTQPCGSRQSLAFVDRWDPVTGRHTGGLEEVAIPEYPADVSEAGRALRAKRVELGLGVREAAALLGIRGVELCMLETGALTAPAEELAAAVEAWRARRAAGRE